MKILFGSILIARLARNPVHVKDVLECIFNTTINMPNHHMFDFKVLYNIPSSEKDFFKKLKEKLSDPNFTVKLCNHGFLLISIDIKNQLNKDEKAALTSLVIEDIESPIQRNLDLFDYDDTFGPDDEQKCLPNKSFLVSDFSNSASESQVVFDSTRNYHNIITDTLKKISSRYDTSLDSKAKEDFLQRILYLLMIARSQYLRHYNSKRQCSVVKNLHVYDKITSEFSGTVNTNKPLFNVLIHSSKKFIRDESGLDEVFVIAMDIVDFSKNLITNFHSSLEDQLLQFNTLTNWLVFWLKEKNKTQLASSKTPFSTTDYWIKCIGDGYIIAFKKPEDVIDLAKYLQSKEKQNKIPLRVGLNFGTVKSVSDSLDREDLIDPAVTLAYRVMSVGGAGNILLPMNFIQKLEENHGKGFIIGENIGTHEVKHNIPIELFNMHNNEYGQECIPISKAKLKTN